MKRLRATDFIIARYLAIAAAAGAAVAQGFAYFTQQPYWNTVAFVAALITLAAIAGLWRAASRRHEALTEVSAESEQQQEVMQALNAELEIHRNLERELVEAKQTAESAVMAKGEFLATMSHEIRTPLNGIIPMLELLMNSKLPPDQHDFLRTAYTSARQMLRIVDDILDFSKLEANKLQLETTSFNLRDLLDSIIRLMEKPAEAKGLRLVLQIDPAVRLALRGDPVRLRQIITNLISNALKFTERGSVTLVVSRKGETRTQHELRFEVRDTGIGIAKDAAKNLFAAFAQADASTTRLYGGTGLGLVICKRIVDLMGGQIGVESEPGRGATFWFEIPLLKAVGDMQGQRADLNGARLLLLSNDQPLRQRIQQAGPQWGAQVTVSESTQDTLARLRAALTRGPTWSFDLLLVDLNSVRSTAIALHRNLQRSTDFEGLPVVWLKGTESPPPELSEGQQVLILSRAMGSPEMRTAISTFIATPAPARLAPRGAPDPVAPDTVSATSSSTPAPVNALRGNVLLVEDNPINQKVAQSLIKILGLDCDTVENGELAIQRMAKGDLDVVLMDCQMPVKDGYTATREWRLIESERGLTPLPIIAMTANAMAGDRMKCLDAGMDDYLSKPVDRRLLESCLALWLQRSPRREAGGRRHPPGEIQIPAEMTANTVPSRPVTTNAVAAAAALADAELAAMRAPMPVPQFTPASPLPETAPPRAPTPFPATHAAPEPFPEARPAPAPPAAATAPPAGLPTPPPVLDLEVVEELRSIMGAEYQGLIKMFFEDAPAHIQKLQSALAANDIPGMIAPAHTLKSSSANLGAMALSSIAKRIEHGARAGNLEKPALAILMIENEYRRARTALSQLVIGA
jgi:signal transduction histidine kinase/DNA-binding response OmpR family regulator/HPt (histidine-containing phosphotransfer) domain-containing protein